MVFFCKSGLCSVYTGDIVFADVDGIVVITQSIEDEVIKKGTGKSVW